MTKRSLIIALPLMIAFGCLTAVPASATTTDPTPAPTTQSHSTPDRTAHKAEVKKNIHAHKAEVKKKVEARKAQIEKRKEARKADILKKKEAHQKLKDARKAHKESAPTSTPETTAPKP